MLIGYDPNDDNRVQFINTDTRYLELIGRLLNRPSTVDDFWPPGHGLISVHVDDFPDVDNVSAYRYDGGNIVPFEG